MQNSVKIHLHLRFVILRENADGSSKAVAILAWILGLGGKMTKEPRQVQLLLILVSVCKLG